jgi:SAM-dependent methyltransferase
LADQAALDRDLAGSESDGEDLAGWWERAHANDHPFWLSGTSGREIWNRLEVDALLMPQTEVLEVGVGLGQGVRALAERGCRVSVIDIAQIALDRVADVAEGYRADRLEHLPPAAFDVALSHLVVQHILDDALDAQLQAVLAALKPGGVFALQYTSWMDDAERPVDMTPFNAKRGGIFRTSQRMMQMARAAGGVPVRWMRREVHPAYGVEWHVLHVAPRR